MNNEKTIEIIPNFLYWISSDKEPKGLENARFFNIDEELVYCAFFSDFGPLNLSQTVRFARQLDDIVHNPEYQNIKLIHHTSEASSKRANAAWLMCAFMLISLGYNSKQVWDIFGKIRPKFFPFRDASYNPKSSYNCYIYDCLRGLEFATQLDWFNIKKFNLKDYEFYEQLENGDLNWIVPKKIIAFSSPIDGKGNEVYKYIKTEDYIPIFKNLDVKLIIRLNNPKYNAQKFIKKGIKVVDLFYEDGSCPSITIIDKFLDLVENEEGPIAVHCKAGLGRTGTLIAMYCMKNYKFKARDFIGWIRLCRPGSVLGSQQHFIIKKEKEMFERKSQIYDNLSAEKKKFITEFHKSCINEAVKENEFDINVLKEGKDKNQANNLIKSKAMNHAKNL